MFMNRDGVEIHKHAKKKQYPAILIEHVWSLTKLLYRKRTQFSCGTQRVVPIGQDWAILPARVANHSAGFSSSRSLTELVI